MANDFDILGFIGKLSDKKAPGLFSSVVEKKTDPLNLLPDATKKVLTESQKKAFVESFNKKPSVLESVVKPTIQKPVQNIVLDSLNKGELDKSTANKVLKMFQVEPKQKLAAPEAQLPTAKKFELFEQTPQFKEMSFLSKMNIVSGVFGESLKEAGAVVGEASQKKAQEEIAKGNPGKARVFSTVGAVMQIPTEQLGSAVESFAFEGLGAALQPGLIGAASATPMGAVFNAVLSQPEIAPHAEKFFSKYEGMKHRFFELYPDTPAQQFLSVAFDIAVFGALTKGVGVAIPNSVKIKVPGTNRTVTVKKGPEFWKGVEKDVKKEVSLISENPAAYIDKVAKGEIKAPKAMQDKASNVSKNLSKFEKMRVQVQDNLLSQKVVQKRITKKGGKIDDITDVYLNEMLYPGATTSKVNKFYKDTTTGIADDLMKANSSLDDLSDLMLLRHATERNKLLGDGAAGIKTREAQIKLVEFAASGKAKVLESAATRIRKLADDLLEFQLKNELISVKSYNKIKDSYKNYVPLNRLIAEKGAFVKSDKPGTFVSGVKRAKGSGLEVENVVSNLVNNWQTAIMNAEKNKVRKSVYEFTKEFPENPLYELVGKDLSDAMGVMSVKIKGQDKYIRVKDQVLFNALINLDVTSSGLLHRTMGNLTRAYSRINTSLSPGFWFTNGVRDLQAAILASVPELGTKAAVSIAKNVLPAQKGIWRALRSKKDTAWTKWFRELEDVGGTTGFFSFRDKGKIQRDIVEQVNGIASHSITGKGKQYGKAVLKLVEDINEVVENATRVAVYRYSRETLGVSKKRGAAIAKNITTNFNKKGVWGNTVNSLFAFANASIQGATRTLEVMSTPKGFATVNAIYGGGAWAVNKWNEQIAPFWSKNTPDYVRQTNFVIYLSDDPQDMIKIPLPWGFNVVKSIHDEAYFASQGQKEISDATKDSIAALFNAYNPLGGSGFSSFVPTVGRPVYDVVRNESWYGGKIAPDFDEEVKDSLQYWKGVDKTFKEITSFLSRASGGEGMEAGLVEVSPESLEYMWKQYTGGLGKFATNIVQTGRAIVEGDEVNPNNVPIVRRFYGLSMESAGLNAMGEIEDKAKSKNFSKEELSGYQELLGRLLEEGIVSEKQYSAKVKEMNKNQAMVKETSALIDQIKQQNPGREFKEEDLEEIFKRLEEAGVSLDSTQKKAIESSL